MRTREEFNEEVFSRGKAGREKKKRIKKSVAACALPLLCIAIGVIAVYIPELSPDTVNTAEKVYGKEHGVKTEEKYADTSELTGEKTDGAYEVQTGVDQPGGKKDPELYSGNSPSGGTYGYADVNALTEALRSEFSDEKLNEKMSVLDESAREVFKEFTKKRIKENVIYVPSFDGEVFTLNDEEGYPKITLFASEAYNMPWIWYHVCVNGVDMIIKTMYADTTEESASRFLKEFRPEAPNTHNYKNYPNYEKVYVKELSIGGKATEVTISELKNDERRYYTFMYKGMLVSIQTKYDLEKEDILSLIAFTEIKLF